MGKSVTVLVLMTLFVLAGVATSFADYRYHSKANRHHYYHSSPAHYRYDYRNHNSYGNRYWTNLGIGFVTGAVFGSVIYRPYSERTIVYTNSPPVIIRNDPIVVYRQDTLPPPSQTELVLRKVESTAHLLNVRSGPGLGARVTYQVPTGTQLDVIGMAPGWLYIKTMAGQYGWVMSQYTREVDGPVG